MLCNFTRIFRSIFFDNSVRSYCIVAGIILVVLVLKRYFIPVLLLPFFFACFTIFGKLLAKKDFVDLVIEPLEWLLVILISVFAIDKLNFPSAWQYKIYGHAIDEIFNKVGSLLSLFYFIWFLLSIIDFIALILEQKAARQPIKLMIS